MGVKTNGKEFLAFYNSERRSRRQAERSLDISVQFGYNSGMTKPTKPLDVSSLTNSVWMKVQMELAKNGVPSVYGEKALFARTIVEGLVDILVADHIAAQAKEMNNDSGGPV